VGGAQSRASFFVSAQDTYEFLIDLLMTMDAARPGRGFAQQALAASESKRARSLLDLLTASGVESAVPLPAEPVWTIDGQRLLDDRTVGAGTLARRPCELWLGHHPQRECIPPASLRERRSRRRRAGFTTAWPLRHRAMRPRLNVARVGGSKPEPS